MLTRPLHRASNLVGIIDVGVDACDILARSTLKILQWVIISTSNLVGIMDVGSIQVYFLGQYVKQTGSRNTADNQLLKCKYQWKKRRQIAEISSAVSYEV